MKIMLLSALCCTGLFLAGCSSSSTRSAKSTASSTATRRSVYNPATDTTTISDGEFTWHLKGNQTNLTLRPRQ